MSDETVWTKFMNFMGGTVLKTINEINLLIPDSILFGSLLLYFLTQNLSFGIFAIFIFETVLSHKLISWVSGQTVGQSRSVDMKCRVGFKTPSFNTQRVFSHEQYPSYGVFSIASIATYLALATKEFSSTMSAMGPEWESRSTVAYVFIGLVLSAFIGVRMIYCENIGEIMTALMFAIIVGAIFYSTNKALFGIESMNFLGLPYIVTKESQGSPIYVCSTEQS
jgi:hypothetical protein